MDTTASISGTLEPWTLRHREAVAETMLLVFALGALVSGVTVIPRRPVEAWGTLALVPVFAGLWWLVRKGKALALAAGMLSFGVLVAHVGSALVDQGASDLMSPWMVVPPVTAFLLLGPSWGWLLGALVIVADVGVFWAEVSGRWLPPLPSAYVAPDVRRLVAYVVVVPLVLAFVSVFDRALKAQQDRRVRLERDLVERARDEQLWRMVGRLAHDINNPMTAVSANLALAAESLAGCGRCEPTVEAGLRDAIAGANRVADLVRDLRAMTERLPEGAQVDLSEVAQAVLDTDELARFPGTRVVDLAATPVRGVSVVLRRVVREMVLLALEGAGGAGGFQLRTVRTADGGVLEVEFPGVAPAPGRLSVSQAIAQRLGGSVEVRTAAGGRGVITLRLPAPVAAAA